MRQNIFILFFNTINCFFGYHLSPKQCQLKIESIFHDHNYLSSQCVQLVYFFCVKINFTFKSTWILSYRNYLKQQRSWLKHPSKGCSLHRFILKIIKIYVPVFVSTSVYRLGMISSSSKLIDSSYFDKIAKFESLQFLDSSKEESRFSTN